MKTHRLVHSDVDFNSAAACWLVGLALHSIRILTRAPLSCENTTFLYKSLIVRGVLSGKPS